MSTETWKSGDLERLKTCVFPDEAQKIVDRRIFEASPEFAAKDFSGKKIEFRNMSGWDLSGLNLTGCKIKTRSLYRANFTDATLNGVYFGNDSAITFEQFAASRSFKKDEICALFGFPLGFEWDFSGKNVERSSKEPPPIAKSKAELTTVVSRSFDGASLDWRRYDDNPWDDRRPRDERLRVRANKEPIRPLATAGE